MAAHNDKLRAVRESTPSRWFPGRAMTRSELAHLVVEHVWFHEGIEAPLDRKYIAKLELGVIRRPNGRYRRALREVLGASCDLELGFMSANRRRAARRLPASAAGQADDDLHQLGALLTGHGPVDAGTATLVDRLWRDDAPERPPRRRTPMPAIVERAREVAHLGRLLDELQADTPATRHPRGRAERARVGALTGAASRYLLLSVAEHSQRAALVALDHGDGPLASAYGRSGARAAELTGDQAFAAHVRALARAPASAGDTHLTAPSPPDPPLAPPDLDDVVRWAVAVAGGATAPPSLPEVPARATAHR